MAALRIRWGTVSNGRVSNASRLPWTNRPPAVINPPGGTAVAGQALPAAHSTPPRGDATLHASSSSSLVSFPVRRESAPHLERYTYAGTQGVCIRNRPRPRSTPGCHRRLRGATLLRLSSGRTSFTTELVGFYRAAGATWTRQSLLLAWCSPSWQSYVEQVTGRPAPLLNKPCSRKGCTTNRFLHRWLSLFAMPVELPLEGSDPPGSRRHSLWNVFPRSSNTVHPTTLRGHCCQGLPWS